MPIGSGKRERRPSVPAVVVAAVLAGSALVRADVGGERTLDPDVARASAVAGDHVQVRGRVATVLDPHAFRLRASGGPDDAGLLVVVITPWRAPAVDETVTARGHMRRLRPAELRDRYGFEGWFASAEARRRRGELVLFAGSVRAADGADLVHEAPPPRGP